MKLNDDELALIHKGLNHIDYTGLGPTKSNELSALINKVGKELEKHYWKVNGSPGIYDTNYICTKCGETDSESADDSYTKPEFGCTGKS